MARVPTLGLGNSHLDMTGAYCWIYHLFGDAILVANHHFLLGIPLVFINHGFINPGLT
jgi:hypothetical protein